MQTEQSYNQLFVLLAIIAEVKKLHKHFMAYDRMMDVLFLRPISFLIESILY